MNDLLLKLLELKKLVKGNGWISIGPTHDDIIELRVEWYHLKEKHGYMMSLNPLQISTSNNDLFVAFINEANHFYSQLPEE